MAGDETRFFRDQKHAGIRNRIAVRAVAQRMNLIEVSFRGIRIRLFRAPLPEHRCPCAGGADGIHADAVFRVVERHGFGEGIHAALGRRVGSVNFLADHAHQAGGVQNAALARQ
jgi:hypothetical protein